MKPETAILKNNKPFCFPDFSDNIHYEAELVLNICKDGKNISKSEAFEYYDKITCGIDFTARDLQYEAMEKGLPWEISKAFDGSAPIGKFLSVSDLKNVDNISFLLTVNNVIKQKGNSADLIFNFNNIISYVSRFVTLNKGDFIFTGTPKGVGKVLPGDCLEIFLENTKVLETEIKNCL
jgi:2-keto-4-pentenoate hydratase/2-oxohepta-3-ene-1,7-dioic acid hydratase in catechol pathway